MEQKNMIIIIAAVAVVAVAAAAGVLLLNNNNGGSSSDYSYSVYTEIISSDGTVDSEKTVTFKTSTKDNAAYVEAANKAFESASLNVTLSVKSTGGITVTYGTDGKNNSCYYFDSTAKNWVAISDTATQYIENSNAALMLQNGFVSTSAYNALPVTKQAGFIDDPMMTDDYDYRKLPDYYPTSPGQYTYYNYFEIITAEGKIDKTGSVKFYIDSKDNQSFADALIAAYTYYGVGTMTADVTDSGIFWHFNDSTYNTCFYRDASTGNWTFINDTATEYINNAASALMLDHGFISKEVYDALTTEEKAGFAENPTGEGTDYAYYKVPGKTDY